MKKIDYTVGTNKSIDEAIEAIADFYPRANIKQLAEKVDAIFISLVDESR